MSSQPNTFLTPEEYLEIERKADYKSEYYRGHMFAMAGAREAHHIIVLNLLGQVYQQLRSRPCRAYPGDMRVQVSTTGIYTYPDAIVVCDQPRFADGNLDTLVNPAVVVEVLSPSTERYDRGVKFSLYQKIESLKDYLMIASDYRLVDLCTRQTDGKWSHSTTSDPEGVIELQSVGCRLKIADLYEKVEFGTDPGPGMRLLPL